MCLGSSLGVHFTVPGNLFKIHLGELHFVKIGFMDPGWGLGMCILENGFPLVLLPK